MLARMLIVLIGASFLASDLFAQEPKAKSKDTAKFEKIFGQGAAELKFPLRIWVANAGLAIAASEFTMNQDSQFVLKGPVSIGFLSDAGAPQIIRGDTATILVADRATSWRDLANARIILVELENK